MKLHCFVCDQSGGKPLGRFSWYNREENHILKGRNPPSYTTARQSPETDW